MVCRRRTRRGPPMRAVGFRRPTGTPGCRTELAAKMDATSKTLVLRSGTLAQLSNQVKSGYNGGAWNGNGITSSAAAANATHATALGYASAASLLGLAGSNTATFDGQVVDASSLIVNYTLRGDANLDGSVNTSEFTAVAANLNATSKLWQRG